MVLPRKPSDIVRLVLRLPKELHENLVAASRADERSLNAEIIYLLRKALER